MSKILPSLPKLKIVHNTRNNTLVTTETEQSLKFNIQ